MAKESLREVYRERDMYKQYHEQNQETIQAQTKFRDTLGEVIVELLYKLNIADNYVSTDRTPNHKVVRAYLDDREILLAKAAEDDRLAKAIERTTPKEENE